MTSETPEQLVTHLRERFSNRTDVEMQALIVTIWLVGTTQQLARLGIISGGKMKEMDGLDQWSEIDKYRYRLIPPNLLGHCLTSFTKLAATEEIRVGLTRLLGMYYTDAGRQQIIAESLNRILANSPSE
jgi:hypothetical protein